jgi:heme-degrading monooxygenase HmoA
MIVRLLLVRALPNKDVESYLQSIASKIRGAPGMRRVEFIRPKDDSSQYGALMYFSTKEDMDAFKSSELVRSLAEKEMHEPKPIIEQICEVLDI